jgi:glycyl-tRNA synthetase
MKKEGMPELARTISSSFYKAGINASYDEQQSIGKRYARHDEIGTPYCLTVDHQSIQDSTVTIRDRDTTRQERISIEEALSVVQKRVQEG